MIIYAYRSGEIGFALKSPPVGTLPLARAPHSMAESAVIQTAHRNGDGWVIPGVMEAFDRSDYATALHLRLDYEVKLGRAIAMMRAKEILRSESRILQRRAKRQAQVRAAS